MSFLTPDETEALLLSLKISTVAVAVGLPFATATALLYLCLTVALAAGPLFTGAMIDHFFAAACPGDGAGRCGAALAQASRAGIIAALCFHAWAAVHYLLGAIGLGRQIQAAAAHPGAEARGRAARDQVSSR